MSLKNCNFPSPDHPVTHSAHHSLAAAFPASEAFDAINQALAGDVIGRKNDIKAANSVFAFTLKNKAGETESWNIDLKSKGEVTKGLGDKPTGRSIFLLRCLAGAGAGSTCPALARLHQIDFCFKGTRANLLST